MADAFEKGVQVEKQSLGTPIPVVKVISQINLDKPRLKIYKEERVSGIQLTSVG